MIGWCYYPHLRSNMQLDNQQLVTDEWQQTLINQAWELLANEESRPQADRADYGFVVFPIAKAYEGYVKCWLLDMGLISKEVWASKRFRLGRALNPDVPENQRDEWWLFDDVTRACGTAIARQFWTSWLEGRNHIFHFFPDSEKALTLPEARKIVEMLVDTIRQAQACLLESKPSK